jgi:DNA-directed RNA polymerase specialized sigma24 family protein
MNSRSISPQLWSQARDTLVFFFLRRHGRSDAEDLAQETLMAVLSRDDYQFEEQDFLRVCLGFARYILKGSYRAAARAAGGLEFDVAAPPGSLGGTANTEARILLDQVTHIAETRLEASEWDMIFRAAIGADPDFDSQANSGYLRVRLHRARKKLAKFAGWRKRGT